MNPERLYLMREMGKLVKQQWRKINLILFIFGMLSNDKSGSVMRIFEPHDQ